MNSKVLSIAITLIAICLLGAIIKVVLPSRRTGNSLSFAISIIISFSMLTFFSQSVGVNGTSLDIDYSADELLSLTEENNRSFVECFYRVKIQKALYKEKILANKIRISLSKGGENYSIEKIQIKLADLSYFGNDVNIDIAYRTKSVVVEVLNLEEKDVIVYE